MPWFKVDDGLPLNKRVLSIPRRERMAAMGLWLMAGAWVAGELTDGAFPGYMLDELGGTEEQAAALVKAGMWEVTDDGWEYPNWGEYQPTKEQVEESREKERNRKAAWRAAKAAKRDRATDVSQRDNGGTDGGTEPSVPDVSALPVPSRPDPSRPDPTTQVSQSSHVGNRASEADVTDIHLRIVQGMGVDAGKVRAVIEQELGQVASSSDLSRLCATALAAAKSKPKNATGYVVAAVKNREDRGKWLKVLAGESP